MPYTLINHYRAIELSSAQMLAFATASDWGRVAGCEKTCGELIAQLGRARSQSGLTPAQQAEKSQIMKRILAIDAEIRQLAQPAVARYAGRYRHGTVHTP